MRPQNSDLNTGGATQAPLSRSGFGAGIAYLLAALVLFTLMDAVAKGLSAQYHVAQIVWSRFVVNAALLALVFRARVPRLLRTRRLGLQVLRALSQVVTGGLYFVALSKIGMAEAAALFDINPILITLGAALFLGERLGPHRIGGIVVAFLGALIVLRPGVSAFDPAGLFAIAGATTYAAGALLTRSVRDEPFATSLLWSGVVGLVFSSAFLPLVWVPIRTEDLWQIVLLGSLGAIGQAALIRAFSLAEAGLLAPFGYLGLIFSGVWGVLFFGQVPDLWTILGAGVITGAGIYVWWRERLAAALN